VSNVTCREVVDFLSLAATIPLHSTVEVFPLTAGNDGFGLLAAGQIGGAAVLTMDAAVAHQ
jgi:hypothetical protein